MIRRLEISRFKSIRSLTLDCRRVNVFIGEPDTGKTNILDALTFLSCLGWGMSPSGLLRQTEAQRFDTLFFRQFFDEPFRIALDDSTLSAKAKGAERSLYLDIPSTWGHQSQIMLSFQSSTVLSALRYIRSYLYQGSDAWRYISQDSESASIVIPPNGHNLIYLTRHHSRVSEFLREVVAGLGWKLRFDTAHQQFFLSDLTVDPIQDYHLNVLSDSLKRYFFYGAIVLTSSKSIVVLDEPDVFAFPPYPKLLGEMLAKDAGENQYFVTTHNPYFLGGIVEKTPSADLALFVCYRDDDGATQAKRLGQEAVTRVIEQGASVFFNLDALREI